ncbi:MAG: hypothetical protein ACQCN4_10365 [Candidatus Bathyarchaeia archaeon]|jgi:hypothetical protein
MTEENRKVTIPQLYSQLDSFHCSKESRPLHVFTVFPKTTIDTLPSYSYEAGVGAITEKTNERLYKITLSSLRRKQQAYGYLIDSGALWNILIRTVESPTTAGNITLSWLKRMEPVVRMAYMRPDDLLGIMDSLSQIEGSKIGLRGVVLRKYGTDGSLKKWPMGAVYSREEIENTIQNENELLEAIDFTFTVQGSGFRVRMESNGHFVFYEGNQFCFSNFSRIVLNRFNERALRNQRFYSNKERRVVNGEATIFPIALKPFKELTKSDFESLSLHLGRNYSTAVFHTGNPWLLMSVVDVSDGSSFDIHGHSDELLVVPFNKASPESLMKLIFEFYELFPRLQMQQ